MKKLVLLALFTTLFSYIHTQDKWKVEEPKGSFTDVRFTVNEGTWMNLDVSPDGKEIAFDLLGDIYVMPITGGKAKPLAEGLPWEVHPRYSPDGKSISFTSDRGGGDNIWIMDRDGKNMKQVTKEKFRLCNNAVWMPDGEYLVAKKHFTSRRSLGSGEMWLYHHTGGAGQQLTKRKDDQLDVGEPWVSPDGNYVYYSEDMTKGPTFQYNKDPHKGIYMIRRYDRETGNVENVIGGPGGAVRPQISPDGKLLAFVRRVREKTVLYLHDLATGEQWPIFDDLHKDQMETWATFGVYPNYNFTPDGKNIIINAKGKIRKINIDSREATDIPFTVDVKRTMQDALVFEQEVAPETFESKMLRHVTSAPDKNSIAYSAMGHIWLASQPGGSPYRITTTEDLEFYPAFSKDNSSLAWVTWSDEGKGAVKYMNLRAGESSTKTITTEKGVYHSPNWSPSGEMIVYVKGGGNSVIGQTFGKETGVYCYDMTNGETWKVTEWGSNPSFSADGTRIYIQSYADGKKALKSVDLEGNDEKVLFTSKYATEFAPSPDDKWIAFRELFKVYVTTFPNSGKPVDLSAGMKSFPVYKATRDAGRYLHWSDTTTLHWAMGAQYFSRELKDCFLFVEGAPDSLPAIDTNGVHIKHEVKTDNPDGKVVLMGARVITMDGDEVIENGAILIEGNRIKKIDDANDFKIPADAYVMNCNGKTIMPGIVDVHAHMGQSWNGVGPQQQWSYVANLAYGVTTTHDPSANTEMIFSQSEMIKAGQMLGPRVYSTGTILYGAEGDFKAVVNSLDDARAHLRRMKAVGAFSVKSYNQPRRNQRQQIIQAAREQKMMVYPEGGSFFYHNMSQLMDGHTGIEHAIPVEPLYNDVITLWGNSKTGYTPTLVVGYGGLWGEEYWYQKTEVWKNERLLKYYPRGIIDSRSMRRGMAPDEDFHHFLIAEGCKNVVRAGGQVQLGAHGQLHGLGAHWELWMLQQGGMTNMEALRCATLFGARYIGMDKDIGSLEKGKLADLVIMDENPLENIRNSEKISHVMMNGRLYDAETMNEIGNREKKRLPFFWESDKGSDNFEWHDETNGYMAPRCSCHYH